MTKCIHRSLLFFVLMLWTPLQASAGITFVFNLADWQTELANAGLIDTLEDFNAFADGIRWHLDRSFVATNFLRLFPDAWAAFRVEALKSDPGPFSQKTQFVPKRYEFDDIIRLERVTHTLQDGGVHLNLLRPFTVCRNPIAGKAMSSFLDE